MLRQALVSEATVEAFDTGVLHRLDRLEDAQLDTVPHGPGLHRSASEPGTVIRGMDARDPCLLAPSGAS